MASVESSSSVFWTNTISAKVAAAIRYTPLAAKGAVVAAGIFALRNVQPKNYLYAFPVAAILASSYIEGVRNNRWKSVFWSLKTLRALSAVAFGGLALWRFTHLQRDSLNLLRVLTGIFCTTTALSCFHDKITKEMVQDFVGRCQRFNPSKSNLLKVFFSNSLRLNLYIDPRIQSAFIRVEEVEEFLRTFLNDINAILQTFSLSTLAEFEVSGDGAGLRDSLAKKIAISLSLIQFLPEQHQSVNLDRLLDIFVGQTLPASIREVFDKNLMQMFGDILSAKTQVLLDASHFLALQDRLCALENADTVDLSELETMSQKLKEIAQNADRCVLFADQALQDLSPFEEVRMAANKEIIKLTVLQNKHRPANQAPKNVIDLETTLFDHLFTTLSELMANQTEERKVKEAELKQLLCTYFKVDQEGLLDKMEESEISTLKAIVSKGICTKEEVGNSKIFLDRMRKFFTKSLPAKAFSPKVKEGVSHLHDPMALSLIETLTAAPVIIGAGMGCFAKLLFGRFAFYRKANAWVCYPFSQYLNLTLPLPFMLQQDLIHSTQQKTSRLFKLFVTFYPFLIAASLGVRIPYLKTATIAFALMQGFAVARN